MTTAYAVIGASRGIGLEFVRQLAARRDTLVFAVVRNKQKSVHLAAAIQGLTNVHVVEADVTDHKAMTRAAGEVAAVTGGKLDCLIHNAALMDPAVVYRRYEDFKDMDELDTDFLTAYQINTLGLIHALAAFLPLLRASPAPTKKVVVVSTTGADPRAVLAARATHMTAYAASKAAALMVATQWAVRLGEEGPGEGRFVVASVCPGVVDTSGTMGESGDPVAHEMVVKGVEEMNKKGYPVKLETPEESVRAQLQVIDGLTPADNGVFLSHNGQRYFG
ncbi:NAD-P-binding protein [Trametes sanguinea]|nr:NAD-P-binding protein [Trametes sanguinea]